jgi:hypothetical protein
MPYEWGFGKKNVSGWLIFCPRCWIVCWLLEFGMKK